MVEPPGIAPGSGPLITSAFIAISGASPGKTNIGVGRRNAKFTTPLPCTPAKAGVQEARRVTSRTT
jgi:hypothetical protein